MFIDPKNPSMAELVEWFQVDFPDLVNEMMNSHHSVTISDPNPYHIENSVWTHTMMVCQRAENDNKIVKICALLHDIGKPESREILPFNKPKPVYSESNELRNQDKNEKISKSGFKTAFRGHEGISFYKAIEPLNRLQKYGVINIDEKAEILTIISLHGTLFDNIKDGEMYKPEKVFSKFNYWRVFKNFISQVKNDSTGRFYISSKDRMNSAWLLGRDIYTVDQFLEYQESQKVKNVEEDATITILVGVPGSGKDYWLSNRICTSEYAPVVISRDDILMEYAQENNIKGNYSEIWKQLSDEDQKAIDLIMQDKFKNAVSQKRNIIINMTNTSKKSRRKWLNNVPKTYRKSAIIFATSYDEIFKRLKKREKETGKVIPDNITNKMMRSFIVPMYDEVDDLEWVF